MFSIFMGQAPSSKFTGLCDGCISKGKQPYNPTDVGVTSECHWPDT